MLECKKAPKNNNAIQGNTKRKNEKEKEKMPKIPMKEMLKKENENLKLRKKVKREKLREKGITLIALVVTIIILLILAGVTLSLSLSQNGLFSRAQNAADRYKKAQADEEGLVSDLETDMGKYGSGNTPPLGKIGSSEVAKELKKYQGKSKIKW